MIHKRHCKFQIDGMQYVIEFPNDFDSNKQYPVLLFLHGAGSRGNNMETLRSNPFFESIKNVDDFPFIIIAPQCHKNTWFDMFEKLQNLLRKIAEQPFTNKNRIYLIGASMGGYAVWQLAMSMPEYIAAICPICGGGMYWNAERLVNIPIWAFHGKKDEVVFPQESIRMVDAVNRCGGNAKLTLYSENGHDAWSDTYRNREVFEWLLLHENHGGGKVTAGDYYNSDIYG